MQLTCLLVTITALFGLKTLSAPVPDNNDPIWDRVPSTSITTLTFPPETSSELVVSAGEAAAAHGARIVEFFGFPPNGHELGFKAHLTVGAKRAIGKVTEWKVPMTMEVDGKVFRYCPQALCDR